MTDENSESDSDTEEKLKGENVSRPAGRVQGTGTRRGGPHGPAASRWGGAERAGGSLSGKTHVLEGPAVPRGRSVPSMSRTRKGLFCSRDSQGPCLSVTSRGFTHLCKVQRRWPGTTDTRGSCPASVNTAVPSAGIARDLRAGVPPLS